jgi:hypothetical protein
MAATALSAGDIAIIGYLSKGGSNSDAFSFVTFVDIGSGTNIYFTDNGWTGTSFNGVSNNNTNGNESLTRFTASSDIAAGTIIRSYDPSISWTTSGQIGGPGNGNYNGLSLATPPNGGDQITALQSTNSTNPLSPGYVPLYQLDYTGAFENATNDNTGSLVPGLSNATTGSNANTAALKNSGTSFGAFNTDALSTASTKAEWLQAINTDTNWTYNNSSGVSNLPLGNLNVNPVPEPITMFGSLTALVIGAGLKQFRKKFQ